MINIQSKREMQKYEELLIQELGLKPPSPEQPAPPSEPESQQFQNWPYGKTLSRMVKIEFTYASKPKPHPQIRIKRKNMTSSDKFYSRKKQNYSSYIKQMQHKPSQEHPQQSFLTVGSHAIRKMDYSSSVFGRDMRLLEERIEMKRRLKPELILRRQLEQTLEENAKMSNKVLVVKKEKSSISPINISTMTERHKHRSERVGRTPSERHSIHKTMSIEDYIPIRRSAGKKQPFVFGMADKQQNNERIKQRLTAYHDFLWKVNYSNGLYVRPTEEETVYRAYIGKGNNSNMIRNILRRRFWWNIVDKQQGCNFVWTQLRNPALFKSQSKGTLAFAERMTEAETSLVVNQKGPWVKEHSKIFNCSDLQHWRTHFKKHKKSESAVTQKTYRNRKDFLKTKELDRIQNSGNLSVHNHLQQNFTIGNKKALFYNMRRYYNLRRKDVFDVLPLTFHISKGIDDPQYKVFLEAFNQLESKKESGEDVKNMWIVKPGECSNRGNGITVCHCLDEIRLRLKGRERNSDGSLRTFIVQKYMEKPLLYKGRKFDIRHYILLTCINGSIKCYWFPQGYIRTASIPFTLKRGGGPMVHLTNDAIQQKGTEFGKFEKGNKVSYEKFQSYLSKDTPVFYESVLPQMKEITKEAVKACYLTLDPKRREHNFELLGMDFMLDESLKPWLIEINTNPCLEMGSPLMDKIIPSLIENTFRLCLDPLFPPPDDWPIARKLHVGQNLLEDNPFELIFDEATEGAGVSEMLGSDPGLDSGVGRVEQDAQTYENDGAEDWQEK